MLNELLHWFRAARRGTVKASVGDQNVSRVQWVKRGSRKGFWCEFFWFVYLSQPLFENFKIDLHLPLSHYTFSSLFHFTELSNTFSRIHPRYYRNWSYWSVVLFSIGTCCCLGWFESRHCLYIQNRRRFGFGSQTIGDFGLRWMVVLEVTSRVMLSWIGWSVSSSFGKGSWTLVS